MSIKTRDRGREKYMYILAVDDEPSANQLVQTILTKEGHEVDIADDPLEAINMIKKREPGLLLLDIIMLQIDGFEFLRVLRLEGYETPLILTGQDSSRVIRRGISIGAYDYICKPYEIQELITRVQAVILRMRNDIVRRGSIQLFLKTRKVVVDGRKPIVLAPIEAWVLHVLMSHTGQDVSRSQLLELIWNEDEENTTNVVDVCIHRLRAKLEADPKNPQHIIGVRGIGYMLTGK
jgi:DNA-binding response OmpR family regulator